MSLMLVGFLIKLCYHPNKKIDKKRNFEHCEDVYDITTAGWELVPYRRVDNHRHRGKEQFIHVKRQCCHSCGGTLMHQAAR